jgi:hypothetical protein
LRKQRNARQRDKEKLDALGRDASVVAVREQAVQVDVPDEKLVDDQRDDAERPRHDEIRQKLASHCATPYPCTAAKTVAFSTFIYLYEKIKGLSRAIKEVDLELRLTYPSLDKDGDYSALPPAYRPFMEALVTDWRGHRLFGLETLPDYDDLRGLDCLINVAADRLLRTETEHAYALSVWCQRNDMAAGRFDRGLFLRPGRG